jgi:hypothetical protein
VLRGRCYEFESVPFKALDGVVDAVFIPIDARQGAGVRDRSGVGVLCVDEDHPFARGIRMHRGVDRGVFAEPKTHTMADRLVRPEELATLLDTLAQNSPRALALTEYQAQPISLADLERLLGLPSEERAREFGSNGSKPFVTLPVGIGAAVIAIAVLMIG